MSGFGGDSAVAFVVKLSSKKGEGAIINSPMTAIPPCFVLFSRSFIATTLSMHATKQKPTGPSHQHLPQSQSPTSSPSPSRMPQERVKNAYHQLSKHLLPRCHCLRHPLPYSASTQLPDHQHHPASRCLLEHQQVQMAPLQLSQSYL